RLALEPQLAGFARALLAAPRDEALVRDDLGADESLLKIGVDHAGRIVGRRILPDRPGTDLLDPGRIERLQAEQPVRRADHTVQARLLEAELLEELRPLALRQPRDLGLDRR